MNPLNCILLVEDEPTTNFLHKILIQNTDCAKQTISKENGQEALDYLLNPNSVTPDIIFLDINMPVMNGWEFLDEYAHIDEEKKAKIVIIMLSTSLNPADYQRAIEMEMVNGFQNKPLSAETLKEILQQHF